MCYKQLWYFTRRDANCGLFLYSLQHVHDRYEMIRVYLLWLSDLHEPGELQYGTVME